MSDLLCIILTISCHFYFVSHVKHNNNNKSQLQQERTYGGVASSRIRPLTRLVGKFSKSKVSPKKKIRPRRGDMSSHLHRRQLLQTISFGDTLTTPINHTHYDIIK